MTCDVRLQLAEVRCAVASCDVCAEPILVVTCDVHVCDERTDNYYLLFFGVSYNFIVQKWRILAIFHKKQKQKNQFWRNYLEGIWI